MIQAFIGLSNQPCKLHPKGKLDFKYCSVKIHKVEGLSFYTAIRHLASLSSGQEYPLLKN
jgi:hypothetical protein